MYIIQCFIVFGFIYFFFGLVSFLLTFFILSRSLKTNYVWFISFQTSLPVNVAYVPHFINFEPTVFHETWHVRRATRRHANFVNFDILPFVIQTWRPCHVLTQMPLSIRFLNYDQPTAKSKKI